MCIDYDQPEGARLRPNDTAAGAARAAGDRGKVLRNENRAELVCPMHACKVRAMPRYYFDVRDGDGFLNDEEEDRAAGHFGSANRGGRNLGRPIQGFLYATSQRIGTFRLKS